VRLGDGGEHGRQLDAGRRVELNRHGDEHDADQPGEHGRDGDEELHVVSPGFLRVGQPAPG
jgi:hypothetical protein